MASAATSAGAHRSIRPAMPLQTGDLEAQSKIRSARHSGANTACGPDPVPFRFTGRSQTLQEKEVT